MRGALGGDHLRDIPGHVCRVGVGVVCACGDECIVTLAKHSVIDVVTGRHMMRKKAEWTRPAHGQSANRILRLRRKLAANGNTNKRVFFVAFARRCAP